MKSQQASVHMKYSFNFSSREIIVKKIIKALKPKTNEFDSVVVSGYSMALVGSIVAHALKKNIVLVRKPSELRISGYETEGIHNQRCIIIDDLVCTGNTFRRVLDGLKKINCTPVGFVVYNDSYTCTKFDEVPYWGNTKKYQE
jgi:adenine/guanine phosphoribosyltransferase-like PRPP-binding protein